MICVLVFKGKARKLFDPEVPWSWAQMVKVCGSVTLGELAPAIGKSK